MEPTVLYWELRDKNGDVIGTCYRLGQTFMHIGYSPATTLRGSFRPVYKKH